MNKDFIELLEHFKRINKLGWIKTLRTGFGGIGYTFETLIEKKEDFESIPDFKSIEIKTIRKKSKNIIHLISINPDGNYPNQAERILNNIGYPDKRNKEYNILNMNFSVDKWTRIGYSKKSKLIINKKNKTIDLIASDKNNTPILLDVSWSFELLKNHIEKKMKYLAIIEADNKIIDNTEYFKYEKIMLYELKNFNNILFLIEKGIIKFEIRIECIREGDYKGKVRNRGTSLIIQKKFIESMYKKIY